MSLEIVKKLDALAELKSQVDYLNLKKQELIDSVLTDEIKQQLRDIDIEFAPQYEAVNAESAALESDIKSDILNVGESVKGAVLHAVFSKGRVSWDTKALDGYAAAHPEIQSFKKEGDPSVSIRKVG